MTRMNRLKQNVCSFIGNTLAVKKKKGEKSCENGEHKQDNMLG